MRFSYCLGAFLVATAGLANAEPSKVESPNGEPWMLVVPPACERFVPTVKSSHPSYWNQLLTLAACVQNMPVVVARDSDALPDMLEKLSNSIVPSLLLYGEAVQHGPDDVKLRAVYHVGLASQSLITRARCSLGSQALLAELESMLAPAQELMLMAFSIIDQKASEMLTLATDPVSRNMIRSARTVLRAHQVPADRPAPRVQTVRTLRRGKTP